MAVQRNLPGFATRDVAAKEVASFLTDHTSDAHNFDRATGASADFGAPEDRGEST